MTALTWGLFCAATLHLYGFESKLSVFIIMTCGIMAGAVKAQIKEQVVRIQTGIGERVRDITDVTGVMKGLNSNMTAPRIS